MPKIGAYLIKILQFPGSYLLYASKTHFEGYLRQFSFQSISHREFHFYIQVRNAVKHIYYTKTGAENLERFLRICMSLRRQSMHMENGI